LVKITFKHQTDVRLGILVVDLVGNMYSYLILVALLRSFFKLKWRRRPCLDLGPSKKVSAYFQGTGFLIFLWKVYRSQINRQTMLAREWSRDWGAWPNYM